MTLDRKYQGLLQEILGYGVEKLTGRGDIKTLSSFGLTIEHDLALGFPVLTTKKINWFAPFDEMLWMLSGSTNVNDLPERSQFIWKPWADDRGELGSVYGKQMRRWTSGGNVVDQINKIRMQLKNNPNSRRIVLNLWKVDELNQMALPPCFLKNHYVDTLDGYKHIQDVNIGDMVLTDSGSYSNVTETFKTPYSGNIVNIDVHGNTHNIQCTPNHPFLVKGKGYIKSDKIKSGDWLAINKNKNSKLPKFSYTDSNQYNSWEKSFELNSKEEFYFMGYFLGDGWLQKTKNTSKTFISIADRDIEKVLSKLGDKIKLCKLSDSGKNVKKFQLQNKKWEVVFSHFGKGAKNKKIPQFIFDAPPEFIEAFMDGYIDADGYTNDNFVSITTISDNIAYGIQKLLTKIGKKASLIYNRRPKKCIIEGREVNQQNTYNINIYQYYGEKRKSKNHQFDDNFMWVKVNDVLITNVNNTYVYNMSVYENHTYTVNNFINHNCHLLTVFHVCKGELNTHVTMRSSDVPVGLPYNLCQYGLLTHILARDAGLEPGILMFSLVDSHIYENQIEPVKQQLRRVPYDLPELKFIKKPDFDYKTEDFKLEGYRHHPFIKIPVFV